MKRNNSPIRTCIGCHSKLPQNTLIRFVCSTRGILEIEGSKKLPGRGVYVCRSKSCIKNAFKVPKRINALLRVQLSKSVISEFQQTLLEKEKITDEKKETAN